MSKCIKFVVLLTSVLFLFMTGLALSAEIDIDLSTWVVEQYHFPSQGDANWTVSGVNNETAFQSVNADASIFHGGFNSVGTLIQGSFEVTTTGDDDFIGFVFGYQDRGQYYLFDWKQGDQTHLGAFAERGMSVKVVDTSATGGGDPSDVDLWITAGTTNVNTIYHNTIPWADNTEYGFSLNFTPGLFEIEVTQGMATLDQFVLADNTYGSGEFGFYNYSQGSVRYSGFTVEDDPPPIVPEPGTMVLLGSGLAGLAAYRRRRGRI